MSGPISGAGAHARAGWMGVVKAGDSKTPPSLLDKSAQHPILRQLKASSLKRPGKRQASVDAAYPSGGKQ